MFEFLSSLFQVQENEYIEFWDNYSDELSPREEFLLNLHQEDLWNIDFDYYLLAPHTAWDCSAIKEYSEC